MKFYWIFEIFIGIIELHKKIEFLIHQSPDSWLPTTVVQLAFTGNQLTLTGLHWPVPIWSSIWGFCMFSQLDSRVLQRVYLSLLYYDMYLDSVKSKILFQKFRMWSILNKACLRRAKPFWPNKTLTNTTETRINRINITRQH